MINKKDERLAAIKKKLKDALLGFENNGYKANAFWMRKPENNISISAEVSVDITDPGFTDTVIIAVAHNQFKSIKFKHLLEFCKQNSIIFDIKNVFPNNKNTIKL